MYLNLYTKIKELIHKNGQSQKTLDFVFSIISQVVSQCE